MAVHAFEAAKRACQTSGWALSNLHLQKILYIAHMLYMGQSRERLIVGDEFEAWDYGPVLPSIYREVSAYGPNPIRNGFNDVPDIHGPEAQAIDDAVQRLARVSPFRLVEMVHDNKSAWSQVYDPYFRGMQIPDAMVIQEYQNRFPGRV